MKPNETYAVWFSPTRTSEKIAKAVAQGVGQAANREVSLTRSPDGISIPASALAVIAMPVYGGHIPPLAAERLKGIRGADTPAVVVAVYGNRAYGDALQELAAQVRGQGFRIVAAATFIGEHSYSSERYPLSAGRPDVGDLELAAGFGRAVSEKLAADNAAEVDVVQIGRPRQSLWAVLRFGRRVLRLRRSGKPLPAAPVTDGGKCTNCGACVALCPSGAIVRGDELRTQKEKCIRCCACVKGCPQQARTYDTPFAAILSECFPRPKAPQILL